MKRFVLVVGITSALLTGCTSSTGGSSSSLTCEQRFDRDLERVSYTEALGRFTQCLIDRGDRLSVTRGEVK